MSSSDVETSRGVGISRKSSVTSLAVLGVEINIWRCLKSSGWSCWGTGGNTGQRRINGNIIKKSIQCVNARLGPSCLTSSLELHIVTTKVTTAKSSFVPEYFTPLTPPPPYHHTDTAGIVLQWKYFLCKLYNRQWLSLPHHQ